MNAFDLWELTTLYQEATGSAYWLLDFDATGTPEAVWPLPAHLTRAVRLPNSPNVVDFYEYWGGGTTERFDPARVIHFRYPDPREPYLSGLGPLRAAYEQVNLTSEYAAFRTAKFQNHALPSAVISPEEPIGDDERQRLEDEWNLKMRRGGAGRILVGSDKLNVKPITESLGDFALLMDMKLTKEDVCNAFAVPMPFVTGETNLANLQAAERQHAALALRPRLRRRDEKLNEQLVPLYDETGRLFLWSDDPVEADAEQARLLEKQDVQLGVHTVNEVRGRRGLPPVPWGDVPWLPASLWPVTQPRGVSTQVINTE